jgi:hypothetical protein
VLNIGLHYYIICVKYLFVHRYSGNAQIYGLKCFNYSLRIYWGPSCLYDLGSPEHMLEAYHVACLGYSAYCIR